MSENHKKIGSAWIRDYDKRMAAEFPDGRILCDYPTILGTACRGSVMERHHVIELADGGHRFGTRPACERHHKDMSDRNRAARKTKPRTTTPRARTKQPAAPARPPMSRRARAWRLITGAYILTSAAALWFVHDAARALLGVLALFVVAVAASTYVGETSTGRALARRKVGLYAAQFLPTEPATVRSVPRRHEGTSPWVWQPGWFGIPMRTRLTAGRVHYGVTVDDSPGSPSQKQVARIFALKLRARVRFDPEGNYFDWWRVDDDDAPADSAALSPDAVSEPAKDDLAEALTEDLNQTFNPRGGRTFTVTIERDAEGPYRITVKYPAGFADDQPATRARLLTRAQSVLGVRVKGDWRTADKVVIAERRPPMPTNIRMPLPEVGEKLDKLILPLGVDENHNEHVVDLRRFPHYIVAGATGAGKSITMTVLLYQLLIRGYLCILIDGKGTTFNLFRHWPGVIVVGLANKPEAMAEAMLIAEAIALERYDQIIDSGASPDDFPWTAVLWDELSQGKGIISRWWKRIKQPRNPNREHPAEDAWVSVPRTGREARLHMIAGIQQANAGDKGLGDTEIRGNLPGRLALGPTDKQSAEMMFNRADLGRDIPTVQGRGTLQIGADEFDPTVMVQSYNAPRPNYDGSIRPEDEAYFEQLMELIRHAQRGVPTLRIPTVDALPGQVDDLDDEYEGDGTSSGRRPGRAGGTARRGTRPGANRSTPARTAPSKRPPKTEDEWDLTALAGAVHAYGKVQVVFPGETEAVIVTEVGEDVAGRAQVTYLDVDGQPAVESVDEDAVFTRVRQG